MAVLVAVAVMVPLALPAPASAQTPEAFLDGAEPWTESDCADDVPVVVGSDARAQSDIYSAVTLAGVLGTDCVILAGPRGEAMPDSQRSRLQDADAGGYIVGGTGAVPAAKTAGRDMTRLGGANRWATAQLVGRRASGDTTAGTPTSTETTTQPDTDTFTAVSAGDDHSCGLRTDGTITCRTRYGEADAPAGTFAAVTASVVHKCGVRADGAGNAVTGLTAPVGSAVACGGTPARSAAGGQQDR